MTDSENPVSLAPNDATPRLVASLSDVHVEGRWEVAVLRSPTSRGRLLGIELPDSSRESGIVMITAKDLKGSNDLGRGRPLLADKVLSHRNQAVALLVGPDPAELALACDQAEIKVQSKIPVESINDAVSGRTKILEDDNLFTEIEFATGPSDDESADLLAFESSCHLAHRERLSLELRAAIAMPTARGFTVLTSAGRSDDLAGPIESALGMGAGSVESRALRPGLGFDEADDLVWLAAAATLAAEVTGKPARLQLDRREDLVSHPKSLPAEVQVTSQRDRYGRLCAVHFEVSLDAGAYDLSDHRQIRDSLRDLCSPYRVQRYSARIRIYATNSPPNADPLTAAFAMQFGLERHLDRLGRTLAVDPASFRRDNLGSEHGVLDCCRLEMCARGELGGLYRADPTNHEVGSGSAIAFGRSGDAVVAVRVACRLDPVSDGPNFEDLVVFLPAGVAASVKRHARAALVRGLGTAYFEEVQIAYGAMANTSIGELAMAGPSDLPTIRCLSVPREADYEVVDLVRAVESAAASAFVGALDRAAEHEFATLPVSPAEISHRRIRRRTSP